MHRHGEGISLMILIPPMACKAHVNPCGRFPVNRQAITSARWCGGMTVGMMADRLSVIGLTMEYRPDWSFSRIICIDFDRSQWARISEVALHCKMIQHRNEDTPNNARNSHLNVNALIPGTFRKLNSP